MALGGGTIDPTDPKKDLGEYKKREFNREGAKTGLIRSLGCFVRPSLLPICTWGAIVLFFVNFPCWLLVTKGWHGLIVVVGRFVLYFSLLFNMSRGAVYISLASCFFLRFICFFPHLSPYLTSFFSLSLNDIFFLFPSVYFLIPFLHSVNDYKQQRHSSTADISPS